jgi:hypothetical protein
MMDVTLEAVAFVAEVAAFDAQLQCLSSPALKVNASPSMVMVANIGFFIKSIS